MYSKLVGMSRFSSCANVSPSVSRNSMSRTCGMINRGVIDLVQNSVRAREPDAARPRVRRHHRILHARSPARLQARRAKGLALLLKPPVQGLIAHSPLPIVLFWNSEFFVIGDSYLPIVEFWNSEFVVIGDGKSKKACKKQSAQTRKRIKPGEAAHRLLVSTHPARKSMLIPSPHPNCQRKFKSPEFR